MHISRFTPLFSLFGLAIANGTPSSASTNVAAQPVAETEVPNIFSTISHTVQIRDVPSFTPPINPQAVSFVQNSVTQNNRAHVNGMQRNQESIAFTNIPAVPQPRKADHGASGQQSNMMPMWMVFPCDQNGNMNTEQQQAWMRQCKNFNKAEGPISMPSNIHSDKWPQQNVQHSESHAQHLPTAPMAFNRSLEQKLAKDRPTFTNNSHKQPMNADTIHTTSQLSNEHILHGIPSNSVGLEQQRLSGATGKNVAHGRPAGKKLCCCCCCPCCCCCCPCCCCCKCCCCKCCCCPCCCGCCC
ncbi:hypothetical protein BX070DRAFT_218826 [Coemansia spiralis]|nr:hypothetical protein BX070DRAFT_218826 [Coemansia spiralis]